MKKMKKKIFSIFVTVVVFVLALAFINSVKAATTTVTDITNVDTIHAGEGKPTTTQNVNGDNIEITYSVASLKIIGEGTNGTASEGRPNGYAWLGIRITAPDSASKYKIGNNVETLKAERTFDKYFGINQESLKDAVIKGQDKTFTINVKWLDNGENELSSNIIKVIVKAENITLYNSSDDTQIWNKDIAKALKAENKDTKLNVDNTELSSKRKENGKKAEKDETYKTGSSDIVLGTTIVSIISLVGIYFIKK